MCEGYKAFWLETRIDNLLRSVLGVLVLGKDACWMCLGVLARRFEEK